MKAAGMHSIFCHVHTMCNILARDFHIVLKNTTRAAYAHMPDASERLLCGS